MNAVLEILRTLPKMPVVMVVLMAGAAIEAGMCGRGWQVLYWAASVTITVAVLGMGVRR